MAKGDADAEDALNELDEYDDAEMTEADKEAALREQEIAADWLAGVKKDADDVKKALRAEMEDAHAKHESLKEQIVEQLETLSGLKERKSKRWIILIK